MFRSIAKLNCTNIYRPSFVMSFWTNSHPQFQVEISEWRIQKCSTLLYDYGFRTGQISRILKSPHAVSSIDDKELLSNLSVWLKFGINEKLYTALCAYPELLTLNPAYVEYRFKELMTLFTKKDIDKLLVTCPQVFLDDFNTVFNKVQYLVHMMGAEQKSIVKTRALQFDLDYMKCRHIFMSYAGKFIVNKKAKKFTNPPLNIILSRNLWKYLRLTGLNEEEFEVFCRYYDEGFLEFSVEEVLDEDSDDDNETDDDDV